MWEMGRCWLVCGRGSWSYHRFKAKSLQTDNEFPCLLWSQWIRSRASSPPQQLTTRTGMGMLLTTNGVYVRRWKRYTVHWEDSVYGLDCTFCVSFTCQSTDICVGMYIQVQSVYTCVYVRIHTDWVVWQRIQSVRVYTCVSHRLSHTVALWWSAKTPFDLCVRELGQLRNSRWCWNPHEIRLRNSG